MHAFHLNITFTVCSILHAARKLIMAIRSFCFERSDEEEEEEKQLSVFDIQNENLNNIRCVIIYQLFGAIALKRKKQTNKQKNNNKF